jgi:hypothetical protein
MMATLKPYFAEKTTTGDVAFDAKVLASFVSVIAGRFDAFGNDELKFSGRARGRPVAIQLRLAERSRSVGTLYGRLQRHGLRRPLCDRSRNARADDRGANSRDPPRRSWQADGDRDPAEHRRPDHRARLAAAAATAEDAHARERRRADPLTTLATGLGSK